MKQNGHPFFGGDSAESARIAYLLAGYIRKTLTRSEHDELDDWVADNDDNMKLFEEMTDENYMDENLSWLDELAKKEALEKVRQKIGFNKPGKPVIKWRIWVAAASVLLIAALFFVLKSNHGTKTKPEIAEDVQPGGNKAILTLSDGSVIDLSDAKIGLLKNEHGSLLKKADEGQIYYSNRSDTPDSNLSYNILTTPKKGQYQVTLSDGTKVFLNAESSLKYPIGFSGQERKVQLTGEGYFEVAKDASKPFKVMLTDSTEVQVLGTHFNVMSYPDESAKEITLLEGSIKISRLTSHSLSRQGGISQFLSPGQQGKIINGKIKLVDNVDTSEITGWKNGQFVFHNEEIGFIMRQVQRWYGVQVSYKINSSEHFNATISRNEPISKLLHYLEATNKIHFKIQNNIIYVLP